jgi:hypothetical protein
MSQFETISGKKLRVFPLGPFFKHRYVFFDTDCFFKIYYKQLNIYIIRGYLNTFFVYFNKYKMLEYDHISKSQKNRAFIARYSMNLYK